MRRYTVCFAGGEARNVARFPHGVNFMRATVYDAYEDPHELYAESDRWVDVLAALRGVDRDELFANGAPGECDAADAADYAVLRAEILWQARELGIASDALVFPFYERIA